MKVCILDGKLLDSGKALHRAVSEALDFPDWYGENLDALYDCPCATTGISCAASSSKSSFCSIHAITQMRPAMSDGVISTSCHGKMQGESFKPFLGIRPNISIKIPYRVSASALS